MAVAMHMRWPGVSLQEYEAILDALGLDDNAPDGGVVHLAGEMEGELRVFDVWESAEQFQRFAEGRLREATEAAGIEGEPQVDLYPLHNAYIPELDAVGELAGTSSLPA